MAWEMSAIKSTNKNTGHFFFEPKTLRFFKSRVSSTVHSAGKGRGQYFVTSELYDGDDLYPRKYTIRRFDPATGDVRTADGHSFQEYASNSGAQAAARRSAAAEGDLNDQEWAIVYGKEN